MWFLDLLIVPLGFHDLVAECLVSLVWKLPQVDVDLGELKREDLSEHQLPGWICRQ